MQVLEILIAVFPVFRVLWLLCLSVPFVSKTIDTESAR